MYKDRLSWEGLGLDLQEAISDHEKRIVDLEKCDAIFAVQFKNLCEKLDSLVGWLKAIFIVLLTGGIAFFFNIILSKIK